jgi:hypothetical protein
MKRQRLVNLLRSKIRLAITTKKRGKFIVCIGRFTSEPMPKRAALNWLYTHLRAQQPFIIAIRKHR